MKPIPPPHESCASFNVPIYDVAFHLVVTDDVTRSRIRRSGWLGAPQPGWSGGAGLHDCHAHRFIVLTERRYLCHDLLAHEIFHATHRILEFVGVKFDADHHEAAAYLNGWLNARVYQELRRLKQRVNPTYPRRRNKPGEPATEHGR